MVQKRKHRRGYPVALLIGLDEKSMNLWQIFSHVIKLNTKLDLSGNRTVNTDLYNFHERIIQALRPLLNEGVQSVIIAAPQRTSYAQDFLTHAKRHHAYLYQAKGTNKPKFVTVVGSANQTNEVASLVRTKEFQMIVSETTSAETDQIVHDLEKRLSTSENDSAILYSLKEIEDSICGQGKTFTNRAASLILTDEYLENFKDRNRINRLLQISKNRKIKTRTIKKGTPAAERINQLGGIVLFVSQNR